MQNLPNVNYEKKDTNQNQIQPQKRFYLVNKSQEQVLILFLFILFYYFVAAEQAALG